MSEAKEREPDVIMIGDSIIQKLQTCHIWDDLFEPLHCLNFGIGGDLTQGVLWRIQNGILDNIKPKVSHNLGTKVWERIQFRSKSDFGKFFFEISLHGIHVSQN